MGLYEQLERTKLRFIGLFEKMLEEGKIDEEGFEQVLDMLDRMDEFTEGEFLQILRRLTDGAIDLDLWDSP